MKFQLILATILLLVTGCMSKYEWMLRKQDMDIKAKHAETYQPIRIKGPVTISDGAEIISTVPNAPYDHTPIPDSQKTQAELADKALKTGAIITGGALIKSAGSHHDTTIIHQAKETGK